ncbi:hypothetical protein EW146_g7382, partial [Bondarzewia mesenterica]
MWRPRVRRSDRCSHAPEPFPAHRLSHPLSPLLLSPPVFPSSTTSVSQFKGIISMSHTSEPMAGSSNVARRRSVDVGGLALALGEEGSGQGWGGWDDTDVDGELPCYAELLSDMYTQTHIAVSNHDQPPPLRIPEKTRTRLIKSLDSWNFEPHKLPDEEVLFCSAILFQTLFRIEGMQQDSGVSIDQIYDLLCNLRKVYRQQNSYHNFAHALDVLQATHSFLCSTGRVPPVSILLRKCHRTWKPDRKRLEKSLVSCLMNEDLLCLYIASIGHDVGHPGFTNGFMKNAKTPLSSLYDDKSPLEQLHCTLLLHLMRRQGLGCLLDNPKSGARFRKLLLETVLATDMRVHLDFMKRFKRIVDGEKLDDMNKKVLVCQALIKCADISNPCRPLRVSQHWATALAEEWTCQAVLEQYLQLPPSVSASHNPLAEAQSQVFFIENFAKPLFLLTSSGIPQTNKYATQCEDNLRLWQQRCRTLGTLPLEGKSHEHALSPSQLPENFLSAFPMALPASLLRAEQDEWASPSTRASSEISSSSRASSPAPSAGYAARAPPLTATLSSLASPSFTSTANPPLLSEPHRPPLPLLSPTFLPL